MSEEMTKKEIIEKIRGHVEYFEAVGMNGGMEGCPLHDTHKGSVAEIRRRTERAIRARKCVEKELKGLELDLYETRHGCQHADNICAIMKYCMPVDTELYRKSMEFWRLMSDYWSADLPDVSDRIANSIMSRVDKDFIEPWGWCECTDSNVKEAAAFATVMEFMNGFKSDCGFHRMYMERDSPRTVVFIIETPGVSEEELKKMFPIYHVHSRTITSSGEYSDGRTYEHTSHETTILFQDVEIGLDPEYMDVKLEYIRSDMVVKVDRLKLTARAYPPTNESAEEDEYRAELGAEMMSNCIGMMKMKSYMSKEVME